jgi:hypothetical protein
MVDICYGRMTASPLIIYQISSNGLKVPKMDCPSLFPHVLKLAVGNGQFHSFRYSSVIRPFSRIHGTTCEIDFKRAQGSKLFSTHISSFRGGSVIGSQILESRQRDPPQTVEFRPLSDKAFFHSFAIDQFRVFHRNFDHIVPAFILEMKCCHW